MLTIPQALSAALDHHTAGRLRDAEILYRAILDADPDHADSRHLLGLVAHRTGNNDDAADLIRQAIAFNGEVADYHWNLGVVLDALSLPAEAVAAYERSIALDPRADRLNVLGSAYWRLGRREDAVDTHRRFLAIAPPAGLADRHAHFADLLRLMGRDGEAEAELKIALAIDDECANAHLNLGLILAARGDVAAAIACCHRAIAIAPASVDAYNNLGTFLQGRSELDEAVAAYRQAIAITPTAATPWNNLGTALMKMGCLDQAIDAFGRAVELAPDLAQAHDNLGCALEKAGDMAGAFTSFRMAVTLAPDDLSSWAHFARTVQVVIISSVDATFYDDLMRMLDQPSVDPSALAGPVLDALRHHSEFSAILDEARDWGVEAIPSYADIARRLSAIPLFRRLVALSTLNRPAVERMLTHVRHAMIRDVADDEPMDPSELAFAVALALHCWLNEYIFPESDQERAAVEALARRVDNRLAGGRDVPAASVAILASYQPLHRFPWADRLLEREWSGDIRQIIVRHLVEPREEASLRDTIRTLTPIRDAISRSVRDQYEHNPYPRWLGIGTAIEAPRAVDAYLSDAGITLEDYRCPSSPEVLIAGCGTGMHAAVTASQFINARILAVDLSRNSLAYATRKTRELGLINVDYAQADILELGGIGRTFDIVESVGVLHHLHDPMAGWRVLVDLVKPGGLMLIGLYSDLARASVVNARSFIARMGYEPSVPDIRRCRRDLMDLADAEPELAKLWVFRDFFRLSECRDLIFHVQEHRFTIPRIAAALADLDLRFLGFAVSDMEVMRKFRLANPDPDAAASLDAWHAYEEHNPDTFLGMYQFWCRKA